MFGWLLGALIVVAWIAALIDIFRRRHARSLGSSAVWVLVVLIFPIAGTLAYFLITSVRSGFAELDEEIPDVGPPRDPHGTPFGDDLAPGSTPDPDATRFGR